MRDHQTGGHIASKSRLTWRLFYDGGAQSMVLMLDYQINDTDWLVNKAKIKKLLTPRYLWVKYGKPATVQIERKYKVKLPESRKLFFTLLEGL